MSPANKFTFTTYQASLKLNHNDSTKIIFDNIDWPFVHSLAKGKYSTQGTEGYDPISLFSAQFLIYLGEVDSDRKLASALRYDARLCLLCGFNFLKTPSNGSFADFCHRLGDDTFHESLHQPIPHAIALKVIQGGDAAIDSTQLRAHANRFGRKSCCCTGKHRCPWGYSDHDAQRGYKNKEYVVSGYKVHLIVDARSQLPWMLRSPQPMKPILLRLSPRSRGLDTDTLTLR